MYMYGTFHRKNKSFINAQCLEIVSVILTLFNNSKVYYNMIYNYFCDVSIVNFNDSINWLVYMIGIGDNEWQ